MSIMQRAPPSAPNQVRPVVLVSRRCGARGGLKMRASLYLVAGMVGFLAIAGSARADGASTQLAMLGPRRLLAPQMIIPSADLPRLRPRPRGGGGIGGDPGRCGGSCPTETCHRNE